MTAYIAALNREIEAERQSSSTTAADLRHRFVDWYTGLPEISRCRPYAMVELEKAFSTQGKYLSAILLSLGWQRKRKWSGEGQYLRYWIPPPTDSVGQATRLACH